MADYNLNIASIGGTFTNLVTLSATGLPAGATVFFAPAAVTPGSAGAPSVMSIQTATGLARLAHDQRRVRVSLTARSRALAARMAPQIEAVYARVERLLGQEFCNHLYGALDDLIVKLETPAPP